MNQLKLIAEVISLISGVITLSILLIKPFRERIFNSKISKEGERCLLRNEMLKTYYRHCECRRLRQYEFENFIKLYEAYKALGGNSFIDEINEEVREWTITS